MKITLLILWPYKFLKHDYEKFEINKLKEKYKIKILVHNFSKILYPKLKIWRSILKSNEIETFNTISLWKNKINKINKIKKNNLIIYDFIPSHTFKSLIIKFILKRLKIPILIYSREDIPNFYHKLNYLNFISKFINSIKNIKKFLIYLEKKISLFFLNFIKFKKVVLLVNKKKNVVNFTGLLKPHSIFFNSFDYSNYLIKKSKPSFKKKHIIFLDIPGPYFKDDRSFVFENYNKINIKKWYSDLNNFFEFIEDKFSSKIIIIPHPKVKGLINPFYKNRRVDSRVNATNILISESILTISAFTPSTALSYAIISKKLIMLLTSDQNNIFYNRQKNYLDTFSKEINCSLININEPFDKFILKKVDLNLYKKYKYNYLTNKSSEKKPNYKILGEFLKNNNYTN